MKYFVYQTTNLVNGKIYVGVCGRKRLRNTYLGSGPKLLAAVEKYGRDNFKRETLFEYETAAEAFAKEAEIVDAEFVKRRDTYNYRLGGIGGWDSANRPNHGGPTQQTLESRARGRATLSWLWKNDPEWAAAQREKRRRVNLGNKNSSGRVLSDESRAKLKAAWNHRDRSNAHVVGKKWVCNPTTNERRRVNPDEVDALITSGWLPGKKPEVSKRQERWRRQCLRKSTALV